MSPLRKAYGAPRIFRNRRDAGRRLAGRLAEYIDEDVVVLGLPRGGVPVADEVAKHLATPLDVLLVRKLGAPMQPELALGAIGEDNVRVINKFAHHYDIPQSTLDRIEHRERSELDRRAQLYRHNREAMAISGKSVIIVDDGMATGATVAAACSVARARNAKHITVAIPVASVEAMAIVGESADQVVCLQTPENFTSVGQWYRNFEQTLDEEVIEIVGGEIL